jgi:hypothetical protein
MTDRDALLEQADNESLFIAAATNGISMPLSYAQAIEELREVGPLIQALATELRSVLTETNP